MFLLASLLTFKLICAYKKNEKGEAFFFYCFMQITCTVVNV